MDLNSLFQYGAHRLGNRFLDEPPDQNQIPPWFDRRRFDDGRLFFRQHALSVAFSYFCSLYVGFTVQSLSNAVSFTGESETADLSRRRYLNTMGHLYSWHLDDIVNDRSSFGYRSIRYIRSWHDRVRKQMAAKSEEPINRYVTQYDTALVQAGFVAPLISYPTAFGIGCHDRDDRLSNYVYFWRVIGYILGLQDDVNACGMDLRSTRRIAKEIEREIIVPGLRNPSPTFLRLSEALINGFRKFTPWMTSGIIKGFVYPLMDLPLPKEITWKEYFILKLLKVHFFFMYLVPWYASYWNARVFKMLDRLVPSIVPDSN